MLQEHHPDALLPALFANASLFANVAELLDNIGDAAFLAQGPMGEVRRRPAS